MLCLLFIIYHQLSSIFFTFKYHYRYVTRKMNFGAAAEKLEEIPKEEWLDRLQGVQVTRGDMNKLIMNYLVTGMRCRYFGQIIFCQISTSFGRIIFSRKFIGLMEMCRHGGWLIIFCFQGSDLNRLCCVFINMMYIYKLIHYWYFNMKKRFTW